jgi:hypothetical protein
MGETTTSVPRATRVGSVIFLPHYADVLESVVDAAERRGAVDVECESSLDRAVVAHQIGWYAAATGRPLRCRPDGDRVKVRRVA